MGQSAVSAIDTKFTVLNCLFAQTLAIMCISEKTYESVIACASSFIEDLSAEEVNVHGKRLVRNYMAGIVHVREQLSSARERRKRSLIHFTRRCPATVNYPSQLLCWCYSAPEHVVILVAIAI